MLKFVPISLVIFLSLFWLGTNALAEEQESSPLFTHNLSPIIQVFGLPPTEGGQLLSQGQTKLRLVMDIANNFTTDESSDESLLFDGETTRLTLSLRYGFSEYWEVGIDLPTISHQGGMLDGLIESWHDTFGLPQGGRDNAPRNRLRYSYQKAGEAEGLNFSNSSTGLGDISVNLAYQLNHNPSSRRYIALRGGIKLPTGDTDNLCGSGGTDVHIRLAVTDGETLKHYNISLFASLGILWLEKGEVLSNKQRQRVGFSSVGLGWSPLNRLIFKVQVDGHTAFYDDSHLKQIDSSSAQLAIGGTIKLSEGLSIDLCIIEDIIVDTAPDVTFHAALSYQY